MLYSLPLFALAAAQAAVESAVLSDFSKLNSLGSIALKTIENYSKTTGRASSAYNQYLSALSTAVSEFESLTAWSPAVWSSYQTVAFQTQEFVSALTLYLTALGTVSDDSAGLFSLYQQNVIIADKVWDLFDEDCTAWGSSYYSSAYYISAWFSVAASEMSWSSCSASDSACTAYRPLIDHRCVSSTSTAHITSSIPSTSSAAATSTKAVSSSSAATSTKTASSSSAATSTKAASSSSAATSTMASSSSSTAVSSGAASSSTAAASSGAATATVRCLVRPTGTNAAATSTKFLY